MSTLTELSLFSGGGGGIYGSKLLGWKTIGYVEYDEYCQKIISQRIKDGVFDCAPIFGDIRTFAAQYARGYRGLVDIVTAGFPCQPFSTAGKQRGSDDQRNMWPTTLEVIKTVRPQYAFLENVSGLLGRHRYFETILKDLSETGYNAIWACLSAAEVGAPHKRERLWVLAYTESIGLERGNEGRRSEKGSGKGIYAEPLRSSCGSIEWWKSEPNVGRVANGVADWRNRVRTLGNGQVPRVVVAAWETLIHRDK